MSEEQPPRERPTKVRYSKLQEVQLTALSKLDRDTAEMYYAIGFDAAEVPIRSYGDLAALGRTHSVHVAEADYTVAGYAAWRDESPGVGVIDEMSVHPEFQRFGIGRGLYERIEAEARELSLKEIVVKVWDRAEWAGKFYSALGFALVDERAPERVSTWFEERNAGRPLLRPGESALWAAIRAEKPVEESDD
jgi:N-acetylglutamate synthase-like GNAT family acetyltransferase